MTASVELWFSEVIELERESVDCCKEMEFFSSNLHFPVIGLTMNRLKFLVLCYFIKLSFSYSVYEDVKGMDEIQTTIKDTSFVFDFTDFGAQTGDRGAFSWYASYPVKRNPRKKRRWHKSSSNKTD